MSGKNKKNDIFVVSSPSGAGKNTILQQVLADEPSMICSISATTREPREGEVDGKEYYFLERGEFERRIEAGEFIEWADVHGNLYGTLRTEMDRLAALGCGAIIEIDVQGAKTLRDLGYNIVSVFIMPPSLEELERRLQGRGTEPEEVITRRIGNARGEIARRNEYDYVVINDDLNGAVSDFKAIIRAERCRMERIEGHFA